MAGVGGDLAGDDRDGAAVGGLERTLPWDGDGDGDDVASGGDWFECLIAR